ncbi:MAG: hypothetical protein AAB658_01305, partial [Chloroflexota bacterium]
SVAFTDNEILIKAEICQDQLVVQKGQAGLASDSAPSGKVNEVGAATVVPIAPAIPPPTAGQHQQLDFNFTVPKGKVASLMGVLNYLQSKYERMDLSLHLEKGQMSEQEFEDKVKEAFRQMGIDLK